MLRKLFKKIRIGKRKKNPTVENKDSKVVTKVDEDDAKGNEGEEPKLCDTESSKEDIATENVAPCPSDEAPETSEQDSAEAVMAAAEPAPSPSEDSETEILLESEKQKINEGFPEEIGEIKEGDPAKVVDPEYEEVYKWEVSCCGVDIPLPN